jgi:hypothetical protein
MATTTRRWPLVAALLAFALHLPFVVRYDLHFQTDFALSILMSRAILEGERPIFFWGQAYLGTFGNYLTAVLFRMLGESIPLAAALSLAIWATGVGLTTRLASKLLGRRAALWTGLAALIASPYATHYITQPYTSYETAPVLAVLVIAGLGWSEQLTALPLSLRTTAAWVGLGLILGLGWWTTRLFLPAVGSVGLAVVLRARWSVAALRRVAMGMAFMVPAAVVGASPEILHRLEPTYAQDGLGAALRLAPLSQVPANLLQGLRSLPAYFNGDPVARFPEGVSFIRALRSGRQPYAEHAPDALGVLLDGVTALATAAIVLAAARTGIRAWQQRNLPLLSLCLTPLVHFALIGLSGRTDGGYYEARRYWFGSLLVMALLFGNAMAVAETFPAAAVRAGARVLGALLLVSSSVAQARLLTFSDELAEFRLLVRDLRTSGEHAVVMTWDGLLVSALGQGAIDVMTPDSRRSRATNQVAASERLAVAVPVSQDLPVEHVLFGATFVADGPPRGAGPYAWRRYHRAGGGWPLESPVRPE